MYKVRKNKKLFHKLLAVIVMLSLCILNIIYVIYNNMLTFIINDIIYKPENKF